MAITDWIQVILMVVLVGVTAIYAWRTHVISKGTEKQADASVKMAEEMMEQRYDAVRPIIDIQWEHSTDTRALGEAASLEPEQLSYYVSEGLKSILHNIGLGPAIDVYSFVQFLPSKQRRCDFGTLVIGGETVPRHLSLNQEGDRMFLRAYYKDVYGRWFKSSRDVIIIQERSRALGPLQIRPIPEEELNQND